MQDHQPKVAVREEAAKASSSPVSFAPVVTTDVQAVLAALFAAEAAASVLMGMLVQHKTS
jgi:hypothetical protein